MKVAWSKESSSYMWQCIFGCEEHDHESLAEAEEKFLAHVEACPHGNEVPC